jgi:hypothetical protein
MNVKITQPRSDLVVTWVQPTVRRKLEWNFSRHEIVMYWQSNPKADYVEVERLTYSDDASAWHVLLNFMTPNPYIGPKDWHAE